MKICIDAGHGGNDPGVIGRIPFRLEEKKFNLHLGLLLEEALEKRGHWVTLTRRRDRGGAPEFRAGFSNRMEADLFISIHANSAYSPAAEGMEVFHFPGSDAGRNAATKVLGSMTASFPNHHDRGVKANDFDILRLTKMPAILVECEFLTNPDQLEFLASLANQKRMARAIADGISAI